MKRLIRLRTNLRYVLSQANDIDISEGRVVYYRYREVCQKVADTYGYPIEKVVACFAALSPNLDYRGNLRSLLSVIEGHRDGIPVEQVKTGGYNACRDRAYSYLGDVSFWDTVKGSKIRSFYRNILNPLDPNYVTIDGHAVNIVHNKLRPLKEVVRSRWKYHEIADIYMFVAKQERLLPNQVQAITWFTWKRINNIVYTAPQNHLFVDRSDDYWQTLSLLDEVTPYERVIL